MNSLSLPDWVPWWLPVLVLIPVGLWALAMLVMPFSVFGLKSRLDGIEARLDEVQEDIRSLVLRLPETPAERVLPLGPTIAGLDQTYVQPELSRPPIPPARSTNEFIPRRPARGADLEPGVGDRDRAEPRTDRPAPSPRAEPRLDWRR